MPIRRGFLFSQSAPPLSVDSSFTNSKTNSLKVQTTSCNRQFPYPSNQPFESIEYSLEPNRGGRWPTYVSRGDMTKGPDSITYSIDHLTH